MPKKFTAAVIGLVLAVGGVAAPRSARAADGAPASFAQANAAIRDELSQPGAKPPSLGDPIYARQVSEAFDPAVVDGAKDQPLPAVMDLCSQAVQTQSRYLLLGIGKDDLTGGSDQAVADKLVRLQSQNYLRFQDEMAVAQRFSVACLALEAEKVEGFVKQLKPEEITPARRSGLAEVQRGLVRIVAGVAISQLDPIRPANRRLMLDALVVHIGQIAPAMSKTSRETAAKAIGQVLASPALPQEAKDKLGAIKHTFGDAACDALCSAS